MVLRESMYMYICIYKCAACIIRYGMILNVECNNYFKKYLTYNKYYYNEPIFYKCTKVDLASFPLFLYRKRAIHSWDSKNFWGLCSPVCQCPRLFLKDNINNSLYNVLNKIYFILKWETEKKLFLLLLL